ncbi:hypothetical protein KAM449_44520 [Aeromonas caviae]|uniref:Uncharacterized protein n=1 Tax=Aeromonas caviae TaxID=648 RepID=A0ABD0BIE8_AERCA|nr:hypothetical protein KAM362_45020 [Aeromonas caviae]GJB26748.1 hypothetical protein KAM365_44980 [Aeromonas caviae]GJB52972.1 hypothetical protein KAM372_44330 [Aeromonas caviae]GJB57436.1 hypothetical protein KAM373_44310 [Aeromonas caviae]GJB61904.1 hypothetical protein KAM374_44400 [Aeromonas caviae]
MLAKRVPLGLRSGTGTNVITKPIAITVQGVNIDNGGNDGGDNDGCSGSTGPLSQLTLVSFGLVRRCCPNRCSLNGTN